MLLANWETRVEGPVVVKNSRESSLEVLPADDWKRYGGDICLGRKAAEPVELKTR